MMFMFMFSMAELAYFNDPLITTGTNRLSVSVIVERFDE